MLGTSFNLTKPSFASTPAARFPYVTCRVAMKGASGFTLIELLAVMALLFVLLLVIAATLWGAVRIERADAAVLHRVIVQAQLADQFREDVRRSIACPDSLRDEAAGPECLILKLDDERYIVYRWSNERLARREIAGATESLRTLAAGGDHVAVQFAAPKQGERVVTLRLIESRGTGKSRKNWPLEISAVLGGDRQ